MPIRLSRNGRAIRLRTLCSSEGRTVEDCRAVAIAASTRTYRNAEAMRRGGCCAVADIAPFSPKKVRHGLLTRRDPNEIPCLVKLEAIRFDGGAGRYVVRSPTTGHAIAPKSWCSVTLHPQDRQRGCRFPRLRAREDRIESRRPGSSGIGGYSRPVGVTQTVSLREWLSQSPRPAARDAERNRLLAK
jgi:hypothetical protein